MIYFFFQINLLFITIYADDNTLSYSHTYPDVLIHNVQHDCTANLPWFKDNNMQANPDNFQAISFGRKGNNIITYFSFDTQPSIVMTLFSF